MRGSVALLRHLMVVMMVVMMAALRTLLGQLMAMRAGLLGVCLHKLAVTRPAALSVLLTVSCI